MRISRDWRLGAILLLALLVRVAYLCTAPEPLQQDTDLYRLIAHTLRTEGVFGRQDLEGQTWPTAFRPPLYPLLIAASSLDPAISTFELGALHVALGLLTVACTWRIAREFSPGWHAELAALAVVVDPLLLVQSGQIMTETLAAFLVTLALLALLRLEKCPTMSRGIIAGLSLGLTALCRPTFLPWIALVLVIVTLRTSGISRNKRVLSLALGISFALLPWVIRNTLTIGRPIVSTTHSGYTLLLGNNPAYYEYLRGSRGSQPWTAEPAHAIVDELLAANHLNLVRDEWILDRHLAERAQESMRNDPRGCLHASIDRLRQFWTPSIRAEIGESSVRQAMRLLASTWYVLVYVATVVGIVRDWRTGCRSLIVYALALALSFTAVHSVYWSNLRMRTPLMPVIYLLAASSLPLRRARTTDEAI